MSTKKPLRTSRAVPCCTRLVLLAYDSVRTYSNRHLKLGLSSRLRRSVSKSVNFRCQDCYAYSGCTSESKKRLPKFVNISFSACYAYLGYSCTYIKGTASVTPVSCLTTTNEDRTLFSSHATQATGKPQQSLSGDQSPTIKEQPTFGPGANPWGSLWWFLYWSAPATRCRIPFSPLLTLCHQAMLLTSVSYTHLTLPTNREV